MYYITSGKQCACCLIRSNKNCIFLDQEAICSIVFIGHLYLQLHHRPLVWMSLLIFLSCKKIRIWFDCFFWQVISGSEMGFIVTYSPFGNWVSENSSLWLSYLHWTKLTHIGVSHDHMPCFYYSSICLE